MNCEILKISYRFFLVFPNILLSYAVTFIGCKNVLQYLRFKCIKLKTIKKFEFLFYIVTILNFKFYDGGISV